MSIEIKLTFNSTDEAVAFLASRNVGNAQSSGTNAGKAAPASTTAKAAAQPAASPAPAPTPAAAPAPAEVTQEELSTAVMALAAKSTAKVVEVLAKFGAKKGKEVKVEDRAACLADAKAALAEIEAVA